MNQELVWVRAVPTAMVPDVQALNSRIRRFVGWKWNAEAAKLELSGPVQIKLCKEYRQAIAHGDLELFIS